MYYGKEEGGQQPDDWVKAYREKGFHTESIFDGLVTGTEKVIQDVKSGMWYNPSDLTLPYAEWGWARKQEAERKGEQRLTELRSALQAVEKELARCQRNVESIGNGKSALNRERAITSLSQAERKQSDQLRLVSKQKQRLIDVMNRLEAILRESRTKKYPGKGSPEDAINRPVVPPRQASPIPPPAPSPPPTGGQPAPPPGIPSTPPPPVVVPPPTGLPGIVRPVTEKGNVR